MAAPLMFMVSREMTDAVTQYALATVVLQTGADGDVDRLRRSCGRRCLTGCTSRRSAWRRGSYP